MKVLDRLLSDRTRFWLMEQLMVRRPNDIVAQANLLKRFRARHLPEIYLNQRLYEWARLMRFLSERKFPACILEIGTGRGGSTYFLSRLAPKCSTVVTVDADPAAKDFVAIYDRPKCSTVICVTGDSRSQQTISRVRQALDEKVVDLLYIDGDHSYEGVKADFETYTAFCRQDAIVVFHDIHPDVGESKGMPTAAYSGQVSKFWNEVKTRYPYHEIIESADQDGFGIGIIEYAA